jgi:oligopeptide transport system substrate-binding protein
MMTDADVEFNAFRSGELQVANVPLAVAPQYLDGTQKLDGAVLSSYMSGAVDWFCINLASTSNPILANQDFRLALNYGLDREEYIAIATNGVYFPATRFVLPLVAGSTPDKTYCDEHPMTVYQTTAEVDKAKEHLQKAMDALGITDPSKISIAIKISDATTNKLISENCQDQWQRNLGINVTIDTVTYKAMLDDRVSGNFDLIYAGWMPDYNDPYTYLGYFTSMNSQNGGKFSDARYDELVTTANTFTDAATRGNMYAEAEQILLEKAGLIPLQVRQVPWVCKDNLKNFVRFYLGGSLDFRYAYFE